MTTLPVHHRFEFFENFKHLTFLLYQASPQLPTMIINKCNKVSVTSSLFYLNWSTHIRRRLEIIKGEREIKTHTLLGREGKIERVKNIKFKGEGIQSKTCFGLSQFCLISIKGSLISYNCVEDTKSSVFKLINAYSFLILIFTHSILEDRGHWTNSCSIRGFIYILIKHKFVQHF